MLEEWNCCYTTKQEKGERIELEKYLINGLLKGFKIRILSPCMK